ncbi:MAG TPA: hypothetical protein PKE06_04530 [Flavilitoribacter sp.]|nr:hypothetical protein [Flavilitoribacter sp.]HMQ87397.1 hypothetical protein [Flavilitoribacter sp.]
MSKKFLADVTDETGFKYTIYSIPQEEAKLFVSEHNGKLLEEYSNPKKGHYYYHLENDYVVGILEWDAIAYDSFKGYLANRKSSGSDIKKRIPKVRPIKRIVMLPDFTKIIFYEIDFPGSDTPEDRGEHLFKLKNREVYKLNDGKIVQTSTDFQGGMQFDSLEDYQRLADFVAVQHPFSMPNPVCGLNRYGEHFPNHVNELIESLPALLGIQPAKLDFTLKSLPRLDKVLYQNLIDHEFVHKVFLPLLAYIGQMWIKQNDVDWIMQYDEKYDTWIPDVPDKEGKSKKMTMQLDRILSPGNEEFFPLATVYYAKGSNFY